MKRYMRSIALWVFLNAVMYLLGSFVAASFDIREWDSVGRFLTAWGSICALGFLLVTKRDDR